MKTTGCFRVGNVRSKLGAQLGQLFAQLLNLFAFRWRQGQPRATIIAHCFVEQFLVLALQLRFGVGEGFDRFVNIFPIIDAHKPIVECLDCALRGRAHLRVSMRFLNNSSLVRHFVGFVTKGVERNDSILKCHFFRVELANGIERSVTLFDCILGGSFNCGGRLFPVWNGELCVRLRCRVAIAVDRF